MGLGEGDARGMISERPILLCYDGSEDAKHAIRESAALLAPRPAIVLSVWQDAAALPALAWAGGALPDLEAVYAAARDGAHRTAEDGAGIARAAGFDATATTAEAKGPVWSAIEEAAEAHEAGSIVIGSRGLSGVKSILLGSVSNGVVHHARRPVIVVRRTDA
jgi:nucleotide-binding universal stress UspA family protein